MADTVLIVEDESLIRWSVRERLGQDGLQCLEAENAASARELFNDADLVLLDLNMPGMHGLEALGDVDGCRISR